MSERGLTNLWEPWQPLIDSIGPYYRTQLLAARDQVRGKLRDLNEEQLESIPLVSATVAGSRARPWPPRRPSPVSSVLLRPFRAPAQWRWQSRQRSSPRRRRALRARVTWSLRAWCASSHGLLPAAHANGSRARGSSCSRSWLRRCLARTEGSERMPKLLGLAEQLVEAILDLFAQGVDHVRASPWLVVVVRCYMRRAASQRPWARRLAVDRSPSSLFRVGIPRTRIRKGTSRLPWADGEHGGACSLHPFLVSPVTARGRYP